MSGWKSLVDKIFLDGTTGDDFCRTKPFHSWQEVKTLLNKFDHSWIFRGQEDASWELRTSLERWMQKERIAPNYEFLEQIFFDEFKRGAIRYLPSLIHLPHNTLEWLSLMQHYGCPTRLLDFTVSPYVAAFFALENCKKDGCAIWCIERNWCKEIAVRNFNKEHSEHEQISVDCNFAKEEIFKMLFWKNPKAVQMIFPVSPLHSNERIDMQQGLFLCQGSDETFEDNLEAMDNSFDHIIKIIISPEVRKEAIIDLNKMNINNATLFPGLEGYARSIKNKIWIEK